jgi:hypothetical protein
MSSYAPWQILLTVAEAMFALMATYSLAGLVAVWGARGRGHWFWKLAAVLAFCSLWLFTADQRLSLFFLSQMAVVLLRLGPLKSRSERTTPAASATTANQTEVPLGRRYSLADLLLALVLLSGLLAMLVRLPPQVRWDWYYDVLPGGVMGGFTLVAVWAVEGKQSVWLRAAALTVAFPAILMAGWIWLAQSARGPLGRATAAAALLLIALLSTRIYLAAYRSRLLAYPPTLADNGYLDLLRAADTVDNNWANVDTLSGDELRAYLRKQETALALVRKGLARPCQAVLYETMNDNLLTAEGQRIEKLSQILAAQGRQELQGGFLEPAVESYLADIKLGAAIANGGVMMHDGFGFVSERLGIEGLQKMVARLDDDACRMLAERLLEIDACREPPEASVAREGFYYSRTYPWKNRDNILSRAFLPNEPLSAQHVLFEAAAGEKRARLRLLVCHLSLRRFWLSKKDYPEALEELVPQFLATVPLDPFGDHILTYKKLRDGYLLYSVGYDGIDDSGAPTMPLTLPVPKGDIVVAVDLKRAGDDSRNEIETGK